jgi:two-component system nitrogen regulation sensor histidine kinase NtrY
MPSSVGATPSEGRLGDALNSARIASGWRWLTSGYRLGAAYGLAAILTGVCVWMASLAPVNGPAGPTSRFILGLLSINLVLIIGLALAVGWQVFRLIVDQRRDAGARLHLRFVILFAGAAVVPAVVVALVFGVLVTQGVDRWFSERVSTVVENIASAAKSYVDSERDDIGLEIQNMGADLNDAAPMLGQAPIKFSLGILARQASYHRFEAAYVIDREGRILARAEVDNPPAYLAPTDQAFALADSGELVIKNFDADDAFRTVMRLKGYPDAYLYVLRPEEHGILAKLDEASNALKDYRDSAANRARIKSDFGLSFLETALLVLVGAVWLGMRAANSISAPVASLVLAADRVAGGDLTARVEIERGPKEITDLAGSFNRMTGDLQAQQTALRAAGDEAESRRQFIETVLAGVSAGVIGLDRDGAVSAANRQALVLLGLPARGVNAQALADVAPELSDVAAQAIQSGHDAEAEVDVIRDGDTRRLRVRASVPLDGGLVLTFDDITRLVAAQRNAAWKDVARRIAHEIKNPLTPIQLSAERIRRKYRKDIKADIEIFDRCTDTIIRQVGDIGRMVDEFSAFARMPTPVFAEADVAELLRQAVFAQRVSDPDTVITLEDEPLAAMAVCDARMIGQALTNILKNAGEAILARRTAEPGLSGQIWARLGLVDDDLIIEIEDNGVGLPAKDRHRLTEPYVTTREKGTGLGLAIVKRILEDHGGDLSLTDARQRPGARAVMRITRKTGALAPIDQDVAVA